MLNTRGSQLQLVITNFNFGGLELKVLLDTTDCDMIVTRANSTVTTVSLSTTIQLKTI